MDVARASASSPPEPAADSVAALRAIVANLQNIVTVVDAAGTIRRQYGSAAIFGHDPSTRPGASMFEFIHPEDLARTRDWLRRLGAAPSGSSIEDIEVRGRRIDGSWRLVRGRGRNLLDDPAVAGLIVEVHDETERQLAQLAAERTRDQLMLAADGVRMGFFEYDVAADRFEISDECYLMRGLPPPERRSVQTRSSVNEIHADDRAHAGAALDRAIAGPDDDVDVEFRLPTADGDWMWIHQRARVRARDPAGRAVRIAGIVLDVDRRKRAERGLVQSEARYRTVIAMTPGFMHESVRDAGGRFVLRWASEGLTRLLGWTIAEVNERGGWDAILHDDDRDRAVRRRAMVLAGEPVRGELRLRSKSGDWLWFDTSSFPLQEPETGEVIALMGTLYDVTSRRQAEERLRLSEERFRIAAEAVSGIIYERDVVTGAVTCSGGVADVLGLGPEALQRGVDWWLERIHPDDIARFTAERLRDDGATTVASEYRLRHARGHYVEVLDRAVRVRNAAGALVRIVGCAIDMSRVRRVERLLSEAEALAHVGSWEFDVRRGELAFSDEAYRVLGTRRGDYAPQLETLVRFLAPDSAPIVREGIARAIATGEGYDLDVETITASGERRWVRTSCRADTVDGRAVRLYGAFQDIDALKRSELRIQEQSDWLKLAMDAAQLLAWRWYPQDDRFVVEYRSPSFDETIEIGATLEEDLKYTVEADRERMRRAMYGTIETGEAADIEFRVHSASGGVRWLRARLIRATADGGFVAIGTTYEVTGRRAAEDALRASEAMLRSVSENSPDYISIADRDLRLTFVNRTLRGMPPEQIVGAPALQFPAGDPAEIEARLRSVLDTGRPTRFEGCFVRDDGTEVLYEHRVGPVRGPAGVAGVIVYSTDITERRALEREILEISNREQRRIGSDLHDGLGQELTGIALMLRGLASGVERGAPPRLADLQEVMTLVNGAIETTRTLARGLSPVALEGGGLVYALRALAARAREMYGLDVRFRSRVAPRVTLDAAATGHLYRIAQESLTNAARHAAAAAVTVQLTVRGRRVTLVVGDDGCGLAPSARSGMGLKIMRYRAHMLGGELTIEPGADGSGTRVRCTLLQPEPEADAEHLRAPEACRA